MNEWVCSIGGIIQTEESEVLVEKHYTASVLDEWMSMEHLWNDTDREKINSGRKTLYSVGVTRVNEYEALVEWYWLGKAKYWEKNIIQRPCQINEWVRSIGGMILTGESEVIGEKHYTASVLHEWRSMEHWWNDTDRGSEVLGEKYYTASVLDEWMSMEHWWNGTERGNSSTGSKTLYSVGGRWMNEYGALLEWYWQEKAKY
jgi:hypothetical protein